MRVIIYCLANALFLSATNLCFAQTNWRSSDGFSNDNLAEHISESCQEINDINQNAQYYKGGLEKALFCYSAGKVEESIVHKAMNNRLTYLRKKKQEAISDVSFHIDSYVTGAADKQSLQLGRKLLTELIAVDEDAGGRFHFLLGISFLGHDCLNNANILINYLDVAASKEHLLAIALLSNIYSSGYGVVDRDINKSKKYQALFERLAEPDQISYESAIDYLRRQKMLPK